MNMVVAVISVNVYPFLASSYLTCYLGDTGIDVFCDFTVSPDSKETELISSDQEAFPSAGKITGVLIVPVRAWKCVPTAISAGADISEAPGCHLLRQMSS